MTVQAEVTKVSYDCDGSTTEFSITFKCFSTDDIVVIHVEDGVETVLTETTHYSISGNLDTGGKVTTVSTYDSGVKIIIMLDIDLDQETDLPYGGSYTSVSVETMADKLTKICQQLSEKIGRAIKFKASSTETDIEIDDLVANKVLIVNSTGDGLEMGATATEISSAQTYAEAASAAQTAAGLSEIAAAASAAGVNLPSIEEGDADKILQVLDDETGYELVTPTYAASGVNSDITSLTALSGQQTIPTISLTGGQIAFPATAVPSADPNTLDDYEEGAFDVALVAGTSGTITLNGSFNSLSYIKIGGMVFVKGHITCSAVDSPVGTLRMTGLPFTVLNMAEQSNDCGISVPFYSVNAVGVGIIGLVAEGTTELQLMEQTTASRSDDLANHILATTQLWFNFFYQV